MLNINVIVTAKRSHGLGHWYRQRAFIKRLVNYMECDVTTYAITDDEEVIKKTDRDWCNKIYALDRTNKIADKIRGRFDLAILDIGKNKRILEVAKEIALYSKKIIVFDDESKESLNTTLIRTTINPNLRCIHKDEKINQSLPKYVHGPYLFISRKDREHERKSLEDKQLYNLVYFGSEDKRNIIGKILQGDGIEKFAKTIIVGGALNKMNEQNLEACRNYKNITYINSLEHDKWIDLLANASLVLTNYGNSFWESIRFNVPTCTVASEYDQIEDSIIAHSLDITNDLGWYKTISRRKLINCLEMIKDPRTNEIIVAQARRKDIFCEGCEKQFEEFAECLRSLYNK